MVRDQISAEMWEIINRLYLHLRGQNSDTFWDEGPIDFSQQIKEYAILFEGITESTFLHQTGYDFIKAGKFIERAEKTARLVDMKFYFSQDEQIQVGGVLDTAQWSAILRAAGGQDAYHQVYVSDVVPRQVAEFLLLSRDFPRSIHFSLKCLQQAIHAISGCPITHYSIEAERICGRLVSDFSYLTIDDIFERGLHSFLKEVSQRLNRIALELNKTYMFFPIVDDAEDSD
jgi:uncharacterized alpha-E superfamily protein